MAEMLRYASNADLIINAVRAAAGDKIEGVGGDPVYDGNWAEVILHADDDGRYSELWVAPEIEKCVIEKDLWVQPGDEVHSFTGANEAIGTLVLKFDTQEKLEKILADQDAFVKVILKE